MRTRDGYNIRDIMNLAAHTNGVRTEQGSRHTFLLKYEHAPIGICALGSSTDVDRHIIPWFKKATGYDKQTIYNAIKKGSWA